MDILENQVAKAKGKPERDAGPAKLQDHVPF